MNAAADLPSPKPPRVERLNPLPLLLGAALVGGTLIVSAFVLSRRTPQTAAPPNEAPRPESAVPDFLSRPPAEAPPPDFPSDEAIRADLEARLRDQLGYQGLGDEPEAGFEPSAASYSTAAPAPDPARESYSRALRAPVLIPVPTPSGALAAAGSGVPPPPVPSLLEELGIPREPGVPVPPGVGSLLAALPGLAGSAPPGTAAPGAPQPTSGASEDPPISALSPRFDLSRGLRAGALLPAQLITAIDSSVPGDVLAQIERDVYSEDQSRVVIPRGSRLLGRVEAQGAVGTSRLLVAWTRLLLPDGRSLTFPGLPSHQTNGGAGLPGKVQSHAMRAFGNAILLSLVATGLQLSQPQESAGFGIAASPRQIVAAEIGQELARVATELLRRDLNRAPTIRLAAGLRFLVFLRSDLSFSPSLDED